MSAGAYILYIVAGLFAANGMPHYIKGVVGAKHQTPFSKESTAVVNTVWALVNFAVAIIILHYLAIDNHHVIREFILFAVGFVVISLVLSANWSKRK